MSRYTGTIYLRNPRTGIMHSAKVSEDFARALDAGRVEPWSTVPDSALATLRCCPNHDPSDYLVVPAGADPGFYECGNI